MLAIPHTRYVADKPPLLIGHPHLYGWNLGVVCHLDGLSTEFVALLGTRHIHNAIANTEG